MRKWLNIGTQDSDFSADEYDNDSGSDSEDEGQKSRFRIFIS